MSFGPCHLDKVIVAFKRHLQICHLGYIVIHAEYWLLLFCVMHGDVSVNLWHEYFRR